MQQPKTFEITADNCFHSSFRERYPGNNAALLAITSMILINKGDSDRCIEYGFYPEWTLDDSGTPFIEAVKFARPKHDDKLAQFRLHPLSDLFAHDLLLYGPDILDIIGVLNRLRREDAPKLAAPFSVAVSRSLPRPNYVLWELAALEKALAGGAKRDNIRVRYGLDPYSKDNRMSVDSIHATTTSGETVGLDFVGRGGDTCHITTSERHYVFTDIRDYGTWQEDGQRFLQHGSSGYYKNPEGRIDRHRCFVLTPDVLRDAKNLILDIAGQLTDPRPPLD
jgi:hypothetical protein